MRVEEEGDSASATHLLFQSPGVGKRSLSESLAGGSRML